MIVLASRLFVVLGALLSTFRCAWQPPFFHAPLLVAVMRQHRSLTICPFICVVSEFLCARIHAGSLLDMFSMRL